MRTPQLSDEVMCLEVTEDYDEDEIEFASEFDDPLLLLELKEQERGQPACSF